MKILYSHNVKNKARFEKYFKWKQKANKTLKTKSHQEKKVSNIEWVLLYLSRYIHKETEGFVFNFVFGTWF